MDVLMRLVVLSLCALAQSAPVPQPRRDALDVYASGLLFAAVPLHAPVPVLRVLSRAPLRPAAADLAAPSARHATYAHPYAPSSAYYSEPESPATRYADSTPHYADPVRQVVEPSRQYSESIRHHQYETWPRHRAQRPHSPREYEEAREPPPYQQQARGRVPYEYADSYAAPAAAAALRVEPSPLSQLTYVAPYDAYSSREAAPTVLYARARPAGGFTYRRPPGPARAPNKPPLKEREKDEEQPYIIKIHKYRVVKDDLL